jgi:hypothetical protein
MLYFTGFLCVYKINIIFDRTVFWPLIISVPVANRMDHHLVKEEL